MLYNFNSIQIYLYGALHNTHHLKAALHKMHESTLQFRRVYYQRKLSIFQKCTYTITQFATMSQFHITCGTLDTHYNV